MDKEHLKKTVIVAGAMIGAWGFVVGTLLVVVVWAGGNPSPSSPKKTDEKPKTSVAAPKDAKDSTK
jgi:uncharacterized membrane protein